MDEGDTDAGEVLGNYCAFSAIDVAKLVRGWDAVRYPRHVVVANATPSVAASEPLVLRSGASSRGPPPPAWA